MADMRQMFAGATRDVSFNPIPGLENAYLPIPTKTDSLSQLSKKMIDLRKIVESGHSLAVATGMRGAAFDTINPEEKAVAEMGVAEKEQYLAWKGGARLSDFDPATSREPTNKWNGSMATLDKWLRGLRAMYADETLQREHAVWFAVRAPFMVPTITAHVKVLTAGKSMVDQHAKLRPEEMAEYQSAKRILADTAYRVQVIKREINKLTQEIGRAEDVVLTRVRHYQQKVGTKERNEAPENRNRKRRGMPALGAPTDLGGMTGNGREARRRRVDLGPSAGDEPAFVTAMAGARSPEYRPTSPPPFTPLHEQDMDDVI
ncbi:hypothetical protein [Fusarium graminearum dsRNA mycovirus 5]|nr:hypothetical protein [Fusarium graminearum dsRNA mycovirus 5]